MLNVIYLRNQVGRRYLISYIFILHVTSFFGAIEVLWTNILPHYTSGFPCFIQSGLTQASSDTRALGVMGTIPMLPY